MTKTGTNKAILEKANMAIKHGDYEGFLSFCTDDTEWTFIGDRTLHGKDAVRKYMAGQYMEPPEFEVETFIEEGDFLTALGDINLKNEKGKETNYKYCDVWKFKDGKMAALKAFVIEA